MKIAFITEDIFGESVGGVEYHIYNMSQELAKLDNEIFIFSLLIGSKSSYEKKLIFDNQKFLLLDLFGVVWICLELFGFVLGIF